MNKTAFLLTLSTFICSQCSSYIWFLSQGILETFTILPLNIFKKESFDLNFYSNHFFFIKSKNSCLDAKIYNTTFLIKLYIPITFLNRKTILDISKLGTITREFLFLGEIPLITNNGTFIINGYEKIIINSFIKKVGLRFKEEQLTRTNKIYSVVVIPNRGVWLKIELKNNKEIDLFINKEKVCNIYTFLHFFYLSREDILLLFPYLSRLTRAKIETKKKKYFIKHLRLKFQKHLFNCNFYKLPLRFSHELYGYYALYPDLQQPSTLTLPSILTIINHLFFLSLTNKICNDQDDLINKNFVTIGKILQKKFLFGLNSLKRQLIQTLSNVNLTNENLNLNNLYNSKAFISIFSTFFNSSQLVQFCDQTNSLADISHHYRINGIALGNSTFISLQARDIHNSQFGRMCPLETPEGNNTGVILALSLYAQLNSFGDIETPFFIVKNGYVLTKFPAVYLTSQEERLKKIAMADIPINSKGKILQKFVKIRFNQSFSIIPKDDVELIAVSTQQLFSFGASLIPFIEHNDGNRALMGANMQRQAVPLIYPHKPIIGTGLEMQFASDLAIKSFSSGIVYEIMHDFVIILSKKSRILRYFITKYTKTQQDTYNNQRFNIWKGEFVTSGQILADNSTMEQGELALGQNLLIAYMSWNGYNFEDSILINEHLLYSDLLTSIKITKFTLFSTYTVNGPELFTNNIPDLDSKLTKNLDINGIIKKGIFVNPSDLIIGKQTPFTNLNNDDYSFLANLHLPVNPFFGYHSSIYSTTTCFGRVLDIIFCSNENMVKKNFKNTRYLITIFFAQIRKITVGDKLAGRHGNKGIISKILAKQDMPFLPSGKIIDIILNPLGVPSRMNVGQLFEGLLGFAGTYLDRRFKILPFDEKFGENASNFLILKYLKQSKNYTKQLWMFNQTNPGKIIVRDGKTGNCFDNPILICNSYILKLIHISCDKIHSRSTGPYSLLTQQPLKGKSSLGGQRFGEMEVWALEAFGAAYTLQEMLTLKSDDITTRNNLLTSILTNKIFSISEIPISLKLLLTELKALGLSLKLLKITKFNITNLF
jgi:DNA-directed RNA polymerase subunit beta